jgi:phosphoenolpyruvate carboxykinase (ATP)
VEYRYNNLFHLNIPTNVPGVPAEILFPENTWEDKEAYRHTARKLAKLFSEAFDKNYGNQNIDPAIVKECPGK